MPPSKARRAKINRLSKSAPAGTAKTPCSGASAPKPPKPCNLISLRFRQEPAEGERTVVRAARLQTGLRTRRNTSPVDLGPLTPFQIIAPSANGGKAREVIVEVDAEATCGKSTHPMLHSADSVSELCEAATKRVLKFHRSPMAGDSVSLGFFRILNSLFRMQAYRHPVSATACGVPKTPGGAVVLNLATHIEVFPADKFKVELSLPAFVTPEMLSGKAATAGWTTTRDKQGKAIAGAGSDAARAYNSDPALREIGSRADFESFAKDMKKQQLGYVEANPESFKLSLTQTDGAREQVANIDEVIKLVRLIRDAEFRFRELFEWIDTLNPSPVGARVKVECTFLVMKFSATWGYEEHVDDRVFLGYEGSIDLDILRASLDVSFGVRLRGAADAYFFLRGEGALGASASMKKESPDESARPKLKPRGEASFSGGLEGRGLWVVKVTGKVQVKFTASVDDLEVMGKKGAFAGTLVVKREAVKAVVEVSCWLYGSSSEEHTLVTEDPEAFKYEF